MGIEKIANNVATGLSQAMQKQAGNHLQKASSTIEGGAKKLANTMDALAQNAKAGISKPKCYSKAITKNYWTGQEPIQIQGEKLTRDGFGRYGEFRTNIKAEIPAGTTAIRGNTVDAFNAPKRTVSFYPSVQQDSSFRNGFIDGKITEVTGDKKFTMDTQQGTSKLSVRDKNGKFKTIKRSSNNGRKVVSHLSDGTTQVLDKDKEIITTYDSKGNVLNTKSLYETTQEYPKVAIGILNNGRGSEIIEPGSISYSANYPKERFEIEPVLGKDVLKSEIEQLLFDLLSK